MLRMACVGLWLAVSASLVVTASIIGMPTLSIVFEIVRATVWLLLFIGAISLARAAFQEWRQGGARLQALIRRRADGNESSV